MCPTSRRAFSYEREFPFEASHIKTYDWKQAKKMLEQQSEQIDLFARLRVLSRCLERLNAICNLPYPLK
jgi:hypothetical protein